MAFFKLRSQGSEARPAAAAPAESIEAMRRRARHRLIGAAVLVLIGVIGFPLLFDTQPRPVSVDIPIEIPDRNKAKPLAPPTPAAPTSAAPAARVAASPAAGGMITEGGDGDEPKPAMRAEPKADARPETKAEVKPPAKPVEPPKAEAKPERKPESKAAEARPERKPEAKAADAKPDAKPEGRPDAKPEVKAAAKPETRSDAKAERKAEARAAADTRSEARAADAKPAPRPATPADDAARARALLEGKGADGGPIADDAGRFVVQVGAFADADKAREARQKLEKAGLKTYTHVAKTAEGERTRVRVGPFSSRAEADKAAAKVKGLALPASVLTL